jgi:hypothetical protein
LEQKILMLTIMESASVQELNPKFAVFYAQKKWQMHGSESSEQCIVSKFKILADL